MWKVRFEAVITAALAFVAGCGVEDTSTDEQSVSAHDRDPHRNGQIARVMTRNMYLGADLTPVITAPDLPSFVEGAGVVLRQVTATNFPVRVKGLAREIARAEPDLVGLQEVALWRTGPASLAPLLGGPKTATTVRLDFLEMLLDELNDCHEQYVPVVIQEEIDLEAPADENGIAGDGPPPISNAELNARLTMRDVILMRVDAGVRVRNEASGHFQHLLILPVLGNPVASTRGWTRLDARVRGSRWFRFVNTHLEAFEPTSRAAQAGELVAPGGPATGELPVILVGDLNSDDDTVPPVDQQAYRVLLAAGFVERTSEEPTCCIDSYDLRGGTAADFTQQIDHVMTNVPSIVRLVESFVTGRRMHNGWWNSDHAGVVSELRIR